MNRQEKADPEKNGAYVTIFSVLAEGGGICMLGFLSGGRWQFKVQVNDDFISPDFREVAYSDAFEDALAKMDRYPWHFLCPGDVHPEFAKRVWQAYQHRQKTAENRNPYNKAVWEKACGRVRKPRVSAAPLEWEGF